MRYINIAVWLIVTLISTQANCAELEHWPIDQWIDKKFCDVFDDKDDKLNNILIGNYSLGLPFSEFKLNIAPTQDGTFRAVLLADSEYVISIAMRESGFEHPSKLKSIDQKTPMGRVHFSSPLYSLLFGSEKENLLYDSDSYEDFVVLESLGESGSIYLFNDSFNVDLMIEIKIYPSVGCSGFILSSLSVDNARIVNPVLARLHEHILYFLEHREWDLRPDE